MHTTHCHTPQVARLAGGTQSRLPTQVAETHSHWKRLSCVVRARTCRGFGTVRFETPEEALASVEAMNNTEIDARVITVRIDRYG